MREDNHDASAPAPEGPAAVAAPAAAADRLAIVLVPRAGTRQTERLGGRFADALDVSCAVCAQPCKVDTETATTLPEVPHVHVCGQCAFTISELMGQLLENVLRNGVLQGLADTMRGGGDGATLH